MREKANGGLAIAHANQLGAASLPCVFAKSVKGCLLDWKGYFRKKLGGGLIDYSSSPYVDNLVRKHQKGLRRH